MNPSSSSRRTVRTRRRAPRREPSKAAAPPAREPATIRFRFLGSVELEATGHSPVEVRGGQPALVLAWLVLERPRPLRRDDLVELLWPGPLPDHWEGAARHVVSRVRRAITAAGLPPSTLLSTAGVTTLDLEAMVDVDVTRAMAAVSEAERLVDDEAWAGARALVEPAFEWLRAPFLPTSDGEWVDSWRDRVEGAAQRALHVAGFAELGEGRGEAAIELGRAAVDRNPFDEAATRLLMAAWAKAGDRAGALGAYERLRRLLDDQLGVRPSDETEAAYLDLLGEAPRAAATPVPPPAARAPTDVAGPFVGRHDELARFEAQWRQALDAGCRVAVVEGEPGIGKTRLVLEEAEAARDRGLTVLIGRCDPDVGVAHGPFADLLEQLLTTRPDVTDQMGVVASHLAPLVPNLVDAPPDPPPGGTEQVTGRLFRAVGTALLDAATATPLLLVLDDLQWADVDTLALLRHVVGRLAAAPCLVVLTLRHATSEVAGTLAEIHRLTPTTTMPLRGLSVDEVGELLAQSRLELADDAQAVATTVAARTAGNPLYVTQLVREAEASGQPFDPEAVPSAVASLLERRLESLEPDLASTLVLAAVAGPVSELSTLEACSALEPERVLTLVEALTAGRFLEERDADSFGFTHGLVRDAVLASVGATRRSRTHRRVADALIAADADPGVIARHLVDAGRLGGEDALTWSLAAGQAALARAAWATAAEHYATAVRLAADYEQRCAALVGLGRAQRALGDAHGSRVTIDGALTLVREQHLTRATAAATLALVGGGGRGVATDLGDAERAALLRVALEGLNPDDVDLLVPVLAELALALVLTDAAGERASLCERCLALARLGGDPAAIATALWARRIALMGPAGTEARVSEGREAVDLPRAGVPPELRIAAELGLVEDLLELGDRDGADDALANAVRLSAELDHPYWSWATTCWQTLVTLIDGQCDEAEQLAFAAAERAPADHPEAVAALGVNLVDVRLFQGRAGEMLDLLTGAADDNPNIPAYRAVLALCSADTGDLDRARAAYEHFARHRFELPADSNWLLAVAVLADAGATLGDPMGAATLTELLEPWADRQVVLNCYGGGGAYWGPVAHHLGRLAAVRGDRGGARRLLAEAVERSEAFRAPAFASRSRAALAAIA